MKTPAAGISVIVPVYDTPDLDTLVQKIVEALGDRDFEIVLVDDASPDPSIWPSLERLARGDRRVRAFQFERNVGQQAATLFGITEARCDVVVTMDDDLQHDPADIATLLAHSHHDVVIGQFARRQHHFIRILGSRMKAVLDAAIVGKPRGLTMSSFRLLNRRVVDGIVARQSTRPFLPALIFEVTRDVVGVTVGHNRRVAGRSGYTIGKTLRLAGDIVLSRRSSIPGVVTAAGLMFMSFGGGLAAIDAYLAMTRGGAVGWLALAGAVFFVGGANLVALAGIGSSLARRLDERNGSLSSLVSRRSPPPSEARDRFNDARLFRLRE